MRSIQHTIRINSAIQKVANTLDDGTGKVKKAGYFHLFNNITNALIDDFSKPVYIKFTSPNTIEFSKAPKTGFVARYLEPGGPDAASHNAYWMPSHGKALDVEREVGNSHALYDAVFLNWFENQHPDW